MPPLQVHCSTGTRSGPATAGEDRALEASVSKVKEQEYLPGCEYLSGNNHRALPASSPLKTNDKNKQNPKTKTINH